MTYVSLLLSLILFPAHPFPQAANQNSKPAIRSADGTIVVFEHEVDADAEVVDKILKLRQQEYRIREQAAISILWKRLMLAEAEKRKLTAEELLKQDVDAKIGPPSAAELESFYKAKSADYKEPLNQIQEQVSRDWRAERIQRGRYNYQLRILQRAAIEILLPAPPNQIKPDLARLRGDARAPVMIVEFGDFQCPSCRKLHPLLTAAGAKYGEQLAVSFRDFVLPQHRLGLKAAEAARCALEQGKFWEYHDQLFTTGKLEPASLTAHAASVGLDVTAFNSCVASGKYASAVNTDIEDAAAAGAFGTPVLFINGAMVRDYKDQAELERLIEAELARVRKLSSR